MVIHTNCYSHGFQIYGWKHWMASHLDRFLRYQPHVSNCLSHLPLLGPLKTKTKLWFTLLHPQTPLPICCSVVFLYLVKVNGSSLLSFAQAKNLKVIFAPSLSHSLCCFISKSHWLYLCCPCGIWQGQQPKWSLQIKSRSLHIVQRWFPVSLEWNPCLSLWECSQPCRAGSLTYSPASSPWVILLQSQWPLSASQSANHTLILETLCLQSETVFP